MRTLFFLLCCLGCFAQSPQQIAEQLSQAELQYRNAKAMFNPWYTGPLVTPAPTMMPLGQGNVQPYLFISGTYASFNKERKSIALEHNIYSMQVLHLVFTGISNSVDLVVTPGAIVNWQDGHTGGGFNDLSATVGFLVNPESLYIPCMKFTIGETFPTGKYQHLSFNGLNLNATGGGSYQTQFGFAIGKVIWWTYPHPINSRFFVGYTIETKVHVEDFNAYGGARGTHGVVSPGNTLTTDLGLEVSLTERWVAALDVVYVAQNQTRFHGVSIAPVGGGYTDNLSLAPAIEYNWNANLGILWGVQFSVYGRSSPNFAKGQFSLTYTW